MLKEVNPVKAVPAAIYFTVSPTWYPCDADVVIVAPEDDEMLVVLAVCERCSILFRPELLPSVTLIWNELERPELALMTKAKSVSPFFTTEATAPALEALIASLYQR